MNVRELLPLYALGVLDADETAAVDHAVAADSALAAELADLHASTELLVLPVAPAPAVHTRLMASVGAGRFERFAARTAAMFDVTLERARELLGLMDRPTSWTQEGAGLAIVHFDGGPAYAGADCGFVRLEPGAVFPPHKHIGEEASVVLQGRLRDGVSGHLYGPGDELVQAETSEHHLLCEGPEPCIYAARAMNGIEIGGAPARPNRSR